MIQSASLDCLKTLQTLYSGAVTAEQAKTSKATQTYERFDYSDLLGRKGKPLRQEKRKRKRKRKRKKKKKKKKKWNLSERTLPLVERNSRVS